MEAAETVAPGAGQAGEMASRRRLGPNVVCMFEDDRPPVVNGKWPGPRRGVTLLRRTPRLRVGAYCYVVSESRRGHNHGIRVQILSAERAGNWYVRTADLGVMIEVEGGDFVPEALFPAERLRRCAVPCLCAR